ncbi:DUF1642 domain-containing protein [Latilactobacillus sakei]|uniref:DUF1642 domain-containing protein n=1 Tax=Latilactobacillus sakei TaxID=1599 RepID=UPI00338D5B1B
MTDLYIATPTIAEYDTLMLLAEAAGYTWGGGNKPTHYKSREFGRETVIHLFSNNQKTLTYTRKVSCDRDGCTVKTIPNLADIKAIWKVQPDDHKAFFKGKSYKHPLPSDESVIMLEMTDELVEGLMDIHKVLAVEYKPKESEVMPEKVKLPKFMCEWLSDIALMEDYPLGAILESEKLRYGNREVLMWSTGNTANQWKLIDALRYGYEAETEPIYYVRFIQNNSHSFLNSSESEGLEFSDNEETEYIKTKFTMPEILAIDPRYKAFAVPVDEVDGDMNKEGKADD